MVLALPRLLVSSKYQQELISNNSMVLFFFLFDIEITDRVPVKGYCVDNGPMQLSGRNFT